MVLFYGMQWFFSDEMLSLHLQCYVPGNVPTQMKSDNASSYTDVLCITYVMFWSTETSTLELYVENALPRLAISNLSQHRKKIISYGAIDNIYQQPMLQSGSLVWGTVRGSICVTGLQTLGSQKALERQLVK